MRLHIRHMTTYDYSPPAERCALRLRLYPSAYASQKVKSWSVTVNGMSVPPMMTTGFGDREAVWAAHSAIGRVEIVAEGEVETEDTAGCVRGLKDVSRPVLFLRPTALTEAGDAVVALARSVPSGPVLDRLHLLCSQVRDAMDYVPGSTRSKTTAEQSLLQKAGVCQDHAHVFVSAARLMGVPARYVVGYLWSSDDNATATHAWAEAYASDLGWIGFDPANRLCPTDRYVRLGVGFDADDAAPVRGHFVGQCDEALVADVHVTQSQTQQ